MTFSLLGRCAETGRLGMVVCSSSPAVAARSMHARPGVGVAASQNLTDPRLGAELLDGLHARQDAATALARTVATAGSDAEYRQLAVLGSKGRGAAHSGSASLGVHGHRVTSDCVAAGNLLAAPEVLDALVGAFAADREADLGDRLIGALRAGLEAGGEAGPVHAAGLVLLGEVDWPLAHLRVDWDDRPVAALAALWERYAPQLEDYVTRALDPTRAPAYGVAGE